MRIGEIGRAVGVLGCIGSVAWLGGGCGPFGREPVVEAADQASANVPASAARRIEVKAEGMRFRPAEIRVKSGETVQVEVENEGTMEHNLELELPGGAAEFRQNLKPGETRILQFTAPAAPGRFQLYCPVGHHAEQGMTGTLVVDP